MSSARDPPVVLAHFMLGNTYSYTPGMWTRQIQLAVRAGIDAFSLNLGPEAWQLEQALSAARISLAFPNFKLCLSLDMNVLASSTSEDTNSLLNMIETFCTACDAGRHLLRVERRPVLSTFGGHACTFGGIGWEGLLSQLRKRGTHAYFIPSFFLPPQELLSNHLIDSIFSWNSGWPLRGGTIDTSEDDVFIQANKPYMAAVSPCFFTKYGTEPPFGWNKNWIYASDDCLYARRWKDLLRLRPEFIQIVSWNDFGESHYIGPVEGSQPGSERWTDNMPHDGFLELTRYFIRALKNLLWDYSERDLVFVSYRTHPATSRAPRDPVGIPDRHEQARDLISITAILSDPATLRVSFDPPGGAPRLVTTVHLEAGEQTFSVPFVPGNVSFSLLRGHDEVARLEGKEIRGLEVHIYNFNPWTGLL